MAYANRNWNAFIEAIPWFLNPGQAACVGETKPAGTWQPSTPEFNSLFPCLTSLLRSAEITSVAIGKHEHLLFTWDAGQCMRAWLCRPPSIHPPKNLFHAHHSMLQSFGGILERANEPETCWLLNQNEVLTEREAGHDASFLEDYSWAFDCVPGGIPIQLKEYYSIAREANGNETICHRTSGAVLLFAPDHSFTHVKPFAGCPAYTLYTLDGTLSFVDWVNKIAQQLESCLGKTP